MNPTKRREIVPVELTKEVEKSYLDYAMSVIVARALPDVRDGLKPVHRRILYAMEQMGLPPGGKYTKSAKIVGEVLGKYHPHGDSSVYDALVRMAQDFSLRYPLIDGQGNFGSIDNDPAAAMRYTEARMAKITKAMLADLKKDTVEFTNNFDDSLTEPTVLPARIPNLLLNGADGIAVGMATKIPPHNLGEIVDATIHMLKEGRLEKPAQEEELEIKKISGRTDSEEELIFGDVYKLEQEKFEFETSSSSQDLLEFIKGPDFPTAGQIYDRRAIQEVYLTGKGKIIIRAKTEIKETKGGRFQIIVSEMPYQVNKANVVAKIAQLAKDKKIIGIADLRDESDWRGIRVVVELKRNAIPKTVLNKLFQFTSLQTSYPANIVALVDGVPQTLNLRQIILLFLRHRHEIVRRRTIHDLKAAKMRAHILEGLTIALDNLDAVIETIKKSRDADTAKTNLMGKFKFTSIQATAILDMQLRRLAALERKKIENEYKEIKKIIDGLTAILVEPKKMLGVIRKELLEVKEKYADPRRTKVYAQAIGSFSEEDLVPNEEKIVVLTKTGYIKRVARGTFKTQRRGGKGVMGMTTKEKDEIDHLIFTKTHDHIMFFTNSGKVFQLRVWELPEGTRQAKGQAIVNLLNIEPGEKIRAILTREKKGGCGFIVMTTKKGLVKRTSIDKYANIRASGIIAIDLKSGDQLVDVKLTDGTQNIFIVTHLGKCIRFAESDARSMGRDTRGVRGIRVKKEDFVVSAEVIPAKPPEVKDKRRKVFLDLLVIMEKGIGKRTDVYLFPLQKRGGVGVKVANITAKTGKVVCAQVVDKQTEQVIITSKKAQVIKLPLKNIHRLGRDTQGVILMRSKKGKDDAVAAIACLGKSG